MGDSALVMSNLDQPLGIVTEDKSDGSRSHRTTISRGRRRNAGGLPTFTRDQFSGGILCRSATPDDAVLAEQVGDPPRVIFRFETSPTYEASQKLPR